MYNNTATEYTSGTAGLGNPTSFTSPMAFSQAAAFGTVNEFSVVGAMPPVPNTSNSNRRAILLLLILLPIAAAGTWFLVAEDPIGPIRSLVGGSSDDPYASESSPLDSGIVGDPTNLNADPMTALPTDAPEAPEAPSDGFEIGDLEGIESAETAMPNGDFLPDGESVPGEAGELEAGELNNPTTEGEELAENIVAVESPAVPGPESEAKPWEALEEITEWRGTGSYDPEILPQYLAHRKVWVRLAALWLSYELDIYPIESLRAVASEINSSFDHSRIRRFLTRVKVEDTNTWVALTQLLGV